jgi:hypothetical protein
MQRHDFFAPATEAAALSGIGIGIGIGIHRGNQLRHDAQAGSPLSCARAARAIPRSAVAPDPSAARAHFQGTGPVVPAFPQNRTPPAFRDQLKYSNWERNVHDATLVLA